MYVPMATIESFNKILTILLHIGDFMHAEIGKDSAGQRKLFQTVKRRKSLMLKLFASDYNM
jgi:hypothetical protein